MTEAVLSIFYTAFNGKVCKRAQGKVYHLDEKPVYLADMDEGKVIRFCNGYAISTQILDALKAQKVRRILYRRRDQQSIYETTTQMFLKKGIARHLGGHGQLILPIYFFALKPISLSREPKDLPIVSAKAWMHTKDHDRLVPAEHPSFTVHDHISAMLRLRQIAIQKGILV